MATHLRGRDRLLDEAKLIGAGFAAVFVDVDDDGFVDLYVANDKVRMLIGNVLVVDEGRAAAGRCWTDTSEEAVLASR